MKLSNYFPVGNQIVLHLKEYDRVGVVIMPDAQPDKVLRVLKVGELCTKAIPDCYALMQDRPYCQMTMDDDNGNPINVLLATEFDIIGFYYPDPGETQFYVGIKKGKGGANAVDAELNILPGTNIEASPFLNEKIE